jgi:signal transduction histidine kinase
VTTIVLSLLLVGGAAMISRRFDERRRLLEQEVAERRKSEEYREALLVSERAARSEAERATRLKDEFVATLSHELRTPLNAIVGWAGILRSDRRGDIIKQGVEVIERNAKLQAQMIEDLLDMSRVLSGKLLFELQKTDVAGIIEAAEDRKRALSARYQRHVTEARQQAGGPSGARSSGGKRCRTDGTCDFCSPVTPSLRAAGTFKLELWIQLFSFGGC